MEKKRLTHGDVKPANVLLTKDLHCKLGDFGSAKVAKRTGVTSTTGSGQVSSELTRVYAAPERLKGPTKPRKVHDTYSFGLIVHMVLTGEVPFEHYTDANQYLDAVKTGGRPLKDTMDELKESLSSDRDRRIIETLESVMERCWDQIPSRRPEMLDIRDELYELMTEISNTETLQSVTAAISKMKIFTPTKASKRIPLKLFNTRERVFRSEKDDVQMGTMTSVPPVPQQEVIQQHNSEDVSTNSESTMSPTQRQVDQPSRSQRDDVQVATVASVIQSSSQEVDHQREVDGVATISENTTSARKIAEQLDQPSSSQSDDVEVATMALVRQVSSPEVDQQREAEDVATISESTTSSAQVDDSNGCQPAREEAAHLSTLRVSQMRSFFERSEHSASVGKAALNRSTNIKPTTDEVLESTGQMDQPSSSQQDDEHLATMASVLQVSPLQADQRRESEKVSTISESTISSTLREVDQLTSARRDDIEIATTAMSSGDSPQETDQRWESDAMATISESASSSTQNSARMSKFRALYDFSAREADELTIFVDDIIAVDESQDAETDWWMGTKDGKSGWIPANYVEKIKAEVKKLENHQQPSRDAEIKSSKSLFSKFRSFLGKKQPSKPSGNTASNSSDDRRPTIQDVFGSRGKTVLPRNVRSARKSLEDYKFFLKNGKYEAAKTIATNLYSLIESNVNATADDVLLFGDKLVAEKKYLESIAIFDTATILFSKMKNPEEVLDEMESCIQRMREANVAMIDDDPQMKMIVKEHVIPIMRDWLRHMLNTLEVSAKWRCLQTSWVFHHIEVSEGLVGQLGEREQALRVAVTAMREILQNDVNTEHGHLFGALLNNLGAVCIETSRYKEAASFFKQAIDAHKAATDYSDEEERKEQIVKSENGLKIVEQKIK